MGCPFVTIICTVSSDAEMRFAKSSFVLDKIWPHLIDYMCSRMCVQVHVYLYECVCGQEGPRNRSPHLHLPSKEILFAWSSHCFTYWVIFPALFELALSRKYEVPSFVVVHSRICFYTTFFFNLLNFKDFQLSLEYVSKICMEIPFLLLLFLIAWCFCLVCP